MSDLIERFGGYVVSYERSFAANRKHMTPDVAVDMQAEIDLLNEVGEQFARLQSLSDQNRLTGGWRDIGSAPKDGTTVLVFGKPSDLTVDGDLLVAYKKPAAYTAAWDEIDGAFCLSGGSWLGPFVEPTHWQPLPSPPLPLPGGEEKR